MEHQCGVGGRISSTQDVTGITMDASTRDVAGITMDASTQDVTGITMDAADADEVGELSLPNHLVEKIISKVPFPHVFKARVLNKEWRSKFEGVARPASSKWQTYCPAFLHTSRSSYILGFERAQNNWFKMKLEPLKLTPPNNPGPSCVAGALYCSVNRNESMSLSITITNLLSGRMRTIPDPPLPSSMTQNFSLAMVPLDDQHYQLVLYGMVLKSSGFFVERHMYNFGNLTWASKPIATTPLAVRLSTRMTRFEYLDGSMYYLGLHVGDQTPKVIQVNFDDETVKGKAIPNELWMMDHRIGRKGVMRCGSRIVIFLVSFQIRPGGTSLVQEIVHLYDVNTETLELVKLSQSPVLRFHVSHTGDPMIVATKDSIHFCGLTGHLSYSLESGIWRRHDIWNFAAVYNDGRRSVTTVTFEPGLNPFVVP